MGTQALSSVELEIRLAVFIDALPFDERVILAALQARFAFFIEVDASVTLLLTKGCEAHCFQM